MKIYVASSWRNELQPRVVQFLRKLNNEVYDFRNPAEGNNGFKWESISDQWGSWSQSEYLDALKHEKAQQGFALDMAALDSCDACVLVLPCGSSAHLEMGWAAARGKKTVIFMPEVVARPELMYKMCTYIVTTMPAIQLVLHDGHSMNSWAPCSACGDLDGCHLWRKAAVGAATSGDVILNCPYCHRDPNVQPTPEEPNSRYGCLRASCKRGIIKNTLEEWNRFVVAQLSARWGLPANLQ